MVRLGIIVWLFSSVAGAGMSERYRDWLEANPSAYQGRYLLLQQDGKDPYLYRTAAIVLQPSGTGWTASYRSSQERDGKETDVTSAELRGVRIEGSKFEAIHPAIKTAWPGFLPPKFSGRFVRRYPPANAKGPVESGLLLDGDLFFEGP